MGAAPSRETHRRGLFSLEQVSTTTSSNTTGNNNTSGKKQDIVLIPLTKEFFPSPDCPLFIQFHKARCDAAVNYYFRRPGNPGDLSRIPTYGGVRRTGHKARQGKTHTQRRQRCQRYCDVCACDRKNGEDEEEVRRASDDQRCTSNDEQPSCSSSSSNDKAKNMHGMKDGGDDNNMRRSSSCDDEGDDDKAEKNSMTAIDATVDEEEEQPAASVKEVNNEDGTTAIRAGTTNDATRHAVHCAKCGRVLDMDSNSSDSGEEVEEEEDVSYPSREALYRGVIERVEEALFDTDAEMREAYAWSQHRSPSPYYNYNSNGGYYGGPCQARKKVLPVLCAVAFRTDLSKLNNTNAVMNNVGATTMTATATYGMPPNNNHTAATTSRGGGSCSTNGESMTEASAAQDGPFHTQTMLENGVYAFHSIINVVGCFGFVSMEEEVETPRWGNAHSNNNNNEYANGGVDEREEDGGERPGLPRSTALHCPNTQTNTHANDTSIPQASPTQDIVGCDEGNAQTRTATRLQVTHPLTTTTNNTSAASVTSYRHDPYSYSNSVATSCSGGSPTAAAGHSRVPSSISCASAPAPLPQGAGGAQDLRSSLLSLTALGRGGPYDIMTLPPPVAAPLAAMVYLTKSAGEQNLGRITYIAACTYYYQLLQAGVICRYSGLAPATAMRAGTTNPNNNTNSGNEGAGGGYMPNSGNIAAQRFTSNNNTTTTASSRTTAQQPLPAWQGFNSAFLPRECLPPMETFSFSSLLTNIPILCFLYEMKWRWGYLGILKNGTPTAQLNNTNNSFSFASSSMGSAREASAAAAFGRHVRQKQRNIDGNYMASSLASSFSAASAYTSPSNVMPPYNNNNNNYNNISNGNEGSMGNAAMMMMMRGTTTTHSTGGLPGIDGSSGQSISDEMEMWITADSMIHGRISKDLAERLCWSLAERPEVMQERVTHLPSVEDGYWRYRGLVDRQHPPPLPNTALHNINPTSAMMMNGTEAAMPTVGPIVCVQHDTTTTISSEGSVIHPKDVYVMGSDVLPGFDEGDILRYDSEHRVWFADHAIPLEGVVLAAMRPYCKQAREADPTDPNWVTRLVSPSEAAAMENEGYNNFYNVSNANDTEESEETHATYPTPPPTPWQAERMAADPSLRLVHEHVGHFYVYRFCMDGTTYYHGTVPNFSNPKKRRTNNNANNAITSGGSNNNNKGNTYNNNTNNNNNTAAAPRLPVSHKGTHEVPCTVQDEVATSERGSHGGASEAPISKATPSQASFSHTTQQQQTPSLQQGQAGMLYKATSNDNNNTAAAVTVRTEEGNSAAAMPHGTIVVAAAEAASSARKASNNTTNSNNNTSKATGSAAYLPTAAIGRSIASALFFSSSCHDDDAPDTTGVVAASSPIAQVDQTSNATGPAIRHDNNNSHYHHRDGIRGNAVEADRQGMASPHATSLGVVQQQQTSGTTTNSNSNGGPVLSQHTAATLKVADNNNDEDGKSAAAMRDVRRVASRDYGTAAQAPTRRRTTSNTIHVSLTNTNNTTTTTTSNTTTTPAPLFTPPSYLTSRVTSTAVDTARKWVRHLYSYAYGAQSRSRERGPSATPSSTSTTIMAASPSVRVGTTATTTTTPPVMAGTESVQAEQRGGAASHTMRISVGRAEPNMASVQQTGVLQTQQQQQQVAMYAPHNVSNPHASSANGYGTAMSYAGSPVLQPPFRRNEATNNNNTNTSNTVAGYGHYPSTVSPAGAATMMGPAVVTGVQPGMQWSANGSAASPSAGPLPTSHNNNYYQQLPSVTNTTHAAPVYNDIQTQDTTATAAVQAVSTTPMTTTEVHVAVDGGQHTATHELPAGQPASPPTQQLPPQVSNTSEGGVQGDVGSRSERTVHDGTTAAIIHCSPSPPQPVLRRVRRRYKVYPQPMAEVQASPTTTTIPNQQSQLVVDDEHGATGGLQPGTIVHSPVSTKRFVASGSYVWDWRPQ